MGAQVVDEQSGLTAFVLRFRDGGARIVAGSSNPTFFRSKGGDADADEFAFHADPRALYAAMQPAAVVWGHQMRVWSTHNGEKSFFARLVESASGRADCGFGIADCGLKGSDAAPSEGAADGLPSSKPQSEIRNPKSPSPSLHTVTLLDAVNDGLVEKIRKLDAPDETARRDFIAEIRASCPDEGSWNEEYLCRAGNEQSSLLSYPLIEACETTEEVGSGAWGVGSRSGTVLRPTPHSPLPTSLYAGFDVGRKHDRSVLWVLEKVGDVFHTRVVRVMEDATFSAQEGMLDALMQNRAVHRLCVDATGIGAMLGERLVRRFGRRVEAIHFTALVKAELAMPLLRLFQDRLVRVPADPLVREDLHKVRRTLTASRHVRFEAARDEDGHADRFWALALAYHATEDAKGPPRRCFFVPRKPAGWT